MVSSSFNLLIFLLILLQYSIHLYVLYRHIEEFNFLHLTHHILLYNMYNGYNMCNNIIAAVYFVLFFKFKPANCFDLFGRVP